jgi:hypothetical protein
MSTNHTTAPSGEEIQQQMRQVRRELGEDVQEIVDSARTMTDWRHYVRTYPWVCLGAAAVVGFLVVPSRPQVMRPDAATLKEWARSQKLVVDPAGTVRTKPTLLGQLAGMATGALVQGGLSLARQFALQQLAAATQPATRPNTQPSGESPLPREPWS